MADPATVERLILAEVALSDDWLSTRTIGMRLRLSHADLAAALRVLVQAGDLDFDGVILAVEAARYHLPLREVIRGRRKLAS